MRNRIALTALIFLPAYLAAQNPGKLTQEEMHKLHQDSKAYIALLEDPQRDAYQKPHDVIMALDIKEGESVADIGAGSGYFALRLAHHVGDKGRVYAVDINPDMIVYMNRRIRDMQLKNIETILAAPDDPLLMDASIDRFFICDTWHHIANQTQYLALMKKMLKPGGQVIMIDFHRLAGYKKRRTKKYGTNQRAHCDVGPRRRSHRYGPRRQQYRDVCSQVVSRA